MGGKHGKYVYVERNDGWYVKVRVFKSRDPASPDRYIVLSYKTREPPFTYRIMKIEELPEEVKKQVEAI